MIDHALIDRALALAIVASGVLVLASMLGAIGRRVAGHAPGRRWGTVFVLGFGVQLGTLVITTEERPIELAVVLAAVGLGAIAFLWANRRVQAGALLAGAAAPWTLLSLYDVVLLVGRQADVAPFMTVTLAVVGLAVVIAGLGLAALGDPAPPAPDPSAPAGRPGSRRIGVVSQAILAPERVGPFPLSEIAAFAAAIACVIAVGAVGLPRPVGFAAQVAVAALVAAEVRLVARPARARRAFEAFSWLGEWELERVRALTGRGLPTAPSRVDAWLAQLPERPDTRWIRVELLAFRDRLVEARQVAETMPQGTAYERFERAHALDLVDWMRGGPGDPEAVRAAADAIDPADVEDRLRAEVAMAVRETARRAAEHGVERAAAPLVAVRDRLGGRADGQLRRALWRRTMPITVVMAVVVALVWGPGFAP